MTSRSFKDYFSETAAAYAAFRPRYPDALFDFVASLPARRVTAWDCATGNGQAAIPLAKRFDRVIATDASAEQIAHAEPHARIGYRVALADASGIESGSIDLVTVAQALHWLEPDAFFAEARRVLGPGGAVAVWCYARPRVAADIDQVIERFYAGTLAPYWSPERGLVDQGYRSIAMPIHEVAAPVVSMASDMTLDELAGYLRTWSATRKLAEALKRDPVVEVRDELRRLWGPENERRTVTWPLHVRAGRLVADR